MPPRTRQLVRGPTMTSDIRWKPEDAGGHEPYCVNPAHHPPGRQHCMASPIQPGTMQGAPSLEWLADHPGCADVRDAMTLCRPLWNVAVRVVTVIAAED